MMRRRVRESVRRLCGRTPWAPPLAVVRSEIIFGVAVFLLVLATIVLMPSQSYRFYYGAQF